MSFEKASNYLINKGYKDNIIVLKDSSATVQLAALALHTQPAQIAKSLSLLIDDQPIIIVVEGTAKIDNHKYKETFHIKAKMIPFDSVEQYIGHAPGGVCPFGINDNVKVYLDKSLKNFDVVYPACGDDHSAVKLTIQQLEEVSNYIQWVDVCKEVEGN